MQALSLPSPQQQVSSSPVLFPVIIPEREIEQLFRPSVFVGAKKYRSFKNRLESSHFFDQVTGKHCLVLPLNVDSEFQTQSAGDVFDPAQKAQGRQIITLQVSDALNFHPSLFVHTDLVNDAKEKGMLPLIRHPVAESDFIALDYLKHQGFDASMIYNPTPDKKLKTFHVVLYGYFIVADLYTYFKGNCLSFIEEQILNKSLLHQRHFKYVSQSIQGRKQPLRLPYELTLEGHTYALTIDFVDLVGAQGKVNLKDFCQNVNLPLVSKDLGDEHKHRMSAWYFENPKDFDAYALGDLGIYPAWKAYCSYVNELSATVASPDYVIDPALTIGSTTNRILDSKRLEYLGLESDKRYSPLYECYLGKSIFQNLDDETNPAHTQLKVDGGRCHNNAPSVVRLKGALCDIDISGAYTSAMMFLPTFFGIPNVSALEGYGLGTVLKKYRPRLAPYHWTMRFSTKEHLSFDQDVFPSYYGYRWKERKCDTQSYHETGELDYHSGFSKILSRQIINGMLTSDLLDIIEHTWTAKARKEFYAKTIVHSLAYYNPALEIKNRDEFTYRLERDEFLDKMPSYWHSAPLSVLGIESLRELRKQHPKGVPMNTLYKLFGNTSYGAIVSHYFKAQNPITANNITAHIRVMAYLTEKALGLYQTITDGGLFNLNEVFVPKRGRGVSTDKLFNHLILSKQKLNRLCDLKRTGLGGHSWKIKGEEIDSLQILCDGVLLALDDAKQKVNTLCLHHLKDFFPTMPLFKNPHLAFEMKDFFNGATFHGSSNYGFWNDHKRNALKMRGYENKKEHHAYSVNAEGILRKLSTFADKTPAKVMHDAIFENPESVPLNQPFIKAEILKTGSFVHLQTKWQKTPVRPGDNYQKMGIAKWCALNQMTFQTLEQYQNWLKAASHLLRKYSIAFEMFRLNEDGTINYQGLMTDIHKMIGEGVGCKSKNEVLNRFDPHRNRQRLFEQNDALITLKNSQAVMKSRLAEFYESNITLYQKSTEDGLQDYYDDWDEFLGRNES
jgi:hypothetical protein